MVWAWFKFLWKFFVCTIPFVSTLSAPVLVNSHLTGQGVQIAVTLSLHSPCYSLGAAVNQFLCTKKLHWGTDCRPLISLYVCLIWFIRSRSAAVPVSMVLNCKSQAPRSLHCELELCRHSCTSAPPSLKYPKLILCT